jgi:DNA polymerase-1
VRTIGGRLCHLQEGFEHKALNRLLQGSCADWIKRAMLDAHQAGVLDVLTLLLTVHDELDNSVPRTRAGAEATRELHQIMANAYVTSVPVLCGVDIGESWGSLHKINVANDDIERAVLKAA